jgi:hypothetical protein
MHIISTWSDCRGASRWWTLSDVLQDECLACWKWIALVSIWYSVQTRWGEEYIRVWSCFADIENAINSALTMGTISRAIGQWYEDYGLFSQ